MARRDVPDRPLVAADREFDYRTKITLAVSADGRRIGLHRYDRADQVFDLEWCHITVPELMAAVAGARAPAPAVAAAAQTPCCGSIEGGRHVLFRSAGSGGWSGAARLHAALAGGVKRRRSGGRPGCVTTCHGGRGEPYPATVFEQVHPAMGDRVRA